MNHRNLKYGHSTITLTLPDRAVPLNHTEPPQSITPEGFIRDLRSCLYMMKSKIRDAGIVVSDKTRLCQYPIYLPLLTEALMAHGLNREDITFYIAYGTHPPQNEEESLASYGETYRHFKFVHHDCRNADTLVTLGTSSRGTEITLRKEIPEHDLLITFGSVLHHYFAGFGGGRKLLFPGLAGYDSILKNHSLYLDFKHRTLREGCQAGKLDGNPLAMDLAEINSYLPDRLEIYGILNSRREVCEIHFGSGCEDFREVCERYDQFFRVQDDTAYDLVVASAGGYPKDINFIQSHKSIHNAASFVKDGGTLIILAECVDGLGNKSFPDIFREGDRHRIYERMEKQYENNAGTALAMIDKSNRIGIRFVTGLDEDTCRMMGSVKVSQAEAQELIKREKGEVAWIENASMLYR